jgi:hypothetical protein
MRKTRRRARTRLTPVPLYENPAAISPDVLMMYPLRMTVGRPFPPAWNPHIGSIIPTMVSRNPDVIPSGRDHPAFHNRARRRHVNDNIGGERACGQAGRKNHSYTSVAKHVFVSATFRCKQCSNFSSSLSTRLHEPRRPPVMEREIRTGNFLRICAAAASRRLNVI